MNIGVAIVTHNSSRDIARCVESIRKEGLRHIAIVDSNSSDDIGTLLVNMGCEHRVLGVNRGFGYSANRAAQILNTEYVLFINPDALLYKGSIATLRQTLREYPTAGIVGMLLCDSSGKPESMAFGDEPSLKTLFGRRFFRKKIYAKPFTVDWVSGGAFIIQKKLFEQLGGFDESFFMYWEDVDICRRARENGYSVLIDPNAKVAHRRGGSSSNGTVQRKTYRESADRYYKKHYSSTIWRIHHFLRKLY